MQRILVRAALLTPLIFVAACNTTDVAATGSLDSVGQQLQRGRASWYGPGFHGRRTASGEAFHSGAMTAAHRSLPFGTRVRVVNEKTGRSVIVRINDRSPPTLKSVLTLSRGSARAIGITGAGSVALYKLD